MVNTMSLTAILFTAGSTICALVSLGCAVYVRGLAHDMECRDAYLNGRRDALREREGDQSGNDTDFA